MEEPKEGCNFSIQPRVHVGAPWFLYVRRKERSHCALAMPRMTG